MTQPNYLSKSRLDLIHKSPYLYWWKYLSGQYVEPEPTPALTFGKALHCRILEPSEFGKRYTVAPMLDRRTKEGKQKYDEFIAASEGLTVITREQDAQIEAMYNVIKNHTLASSLLFSEGPAELDIVWEEQGQHFRGIVDKYSERRSIIVDLKTTDDASPEGFKRSVWKYRYHVQAAMYIAGMRALGYEVNAFIFVAIEKTPPYQIGLYYLSEKDIATGTAIMWQAVEKFQQCQQADAWPMYDNIITELTL